MCCFRHKKHKPQMIIRIPEFVGIKFHKQNGILRQLRLSITRRLCQCSCISVTRRNLPRSNYYVNPEGKQTYDYNNYTNSESEPFAFLHPRQASMYSLTKEQQKSRHTDECCRWGFRCCQKVGNEHAKAPGIRECQPNVLLGKQLPY